MLADAAHNLSDVLGLAMAWGASALARRAPSSLHTYGFRSSTVLAALANAVLLLAAVGAVAWEAIGRFHARAEPHGTTMMWVAAVGVAVNGVSALLFRRGSKADINVRGAFLHLVADAAVSAGVVIAGALLWRTGWVWRDPATSLLISAVVLYGTWGLLRDALHLAMDGVPRNIELEKVRKFLEATRCYLEQHGKPAAFYSDKYKRSHPVGRSGWREPCAYPSGRRFMNSARITTQGQLLPSPDAGIVASDSAVRRRSWARAPRLWRYWAWGLDKGILRPPPRRSDRATGRQFCWAKRRAASPRLRVTGGWPMLWVMSDPTEERALATSRQGRSRTGLGSTILVAGRRSYEIPKGYPPVAGRRSDND